MPTTFKHLSLVTASLLLMACEGGGSTPTNNVNNPRPIVNDNTNPIFTSVTNFTIKENKRFVVDIKANDETQIEYTIVDGIDKDKFLIDKHNGTLIFKNNPDYETPSDVDNDNSYEITIKATDMGNNSVKQDFTITIEDVKNETFSNVSVFDLNNGTNSKDVGTAPKSVYVLFSNRHKTDSSSPTIVHNKMSATPSQKKEVSVAPVSIHAKRAQHAPAYIQEFNQNVKKLLKKGQTTSKKSQKITSITIPLKKDVVNDSETFKILEDGSVSYTQAKARKVISNISTSFGPKTLNIWVSNDSFGTNCLKKNCVTQEMVDALADTFLKTGLNNDIYDWVTNIYGEEWNSAAQKKYYNVIGATNEITILLTDIKNDNRENGGIIIGYFHSKDNYTNEGSSNERVMFYINAVMFANADAGKPWSIDDAWPKETVGTLAHEFVHMIEFYQKTVLLDKGSETWLAEMMAETTEDLVATKIGHTGPRGVLPTDGTAGSANNEEGRYGRFNAYNTLSLTEWNSQLEDYSKVNAFGTFLTRNYGGAKLMHDMMYNPYNDENVILDAVHKSPQGAGKTFADLQKEWGIAVLLSDQDDLLQDKPTYNTGDFTVSAMNNVVYKMGSINFFNYRQTPTFSPCTTVKPQGNCYYEVGDNLTGTVTIDLTLDATTSATLIVK